MCRWGVGRKRGESRSKVQYCIFFMNWVMTNKVLTSTSASASASASASISAFGGNVGGGTKEEGDVYTARDRVGRSRDTSPSS